MYNLQEDSFNQLFPFARLSTKKTYYPLFMESMEHYSINTALRIATFCAQVEIESGSLRYVREIASGKAYDNRKDLGNKEPEAIYIAEQNNTTTGQFYKGHGLIQITGYYNHRQCGEALGLDLVTMPTLLELPRYAIMSACWFFNTHNCNAMADVGLFAQITKTINGGYNGMTQRQASYNRNKQILKVEI